MIEVGRQSDNVERENQYWLDMSAEVKLDKLNNTVEDDCSSGHKFRLCPPKFDQNKCIECGVLE